MEEAYQESVRRGLARLLKDEKKLDAASRAIADHFSTFLGSSPPLDPSSKFFDFPGKVRAILDRFAADGLGEEELLDAAVREPRLLLQKPETIIAKLEVMESYSTMHGRRRGDYLHAVLSRQPHLAFYDPSTLIDHVEAMVQHFSEDGLTHKGFLQAAIRQPTLFCQDPRTAIANIESVASNFASAGLSRGMYLHAALQHPPLFYQKPTTIIRHVHLAAEAVSVATGENPLSEDSIKTSLSIMCKNPKLFSLSDENLSLRSIYAAVVGADTLPNLLNRSRARVEMELKDSLGQLDRHRPVPKLRPEDGLSKHARNLLLRALVHEGWLGGQIDR